MPQYYSAPPPAAVLLRPLHLDEKTQKFKLEDFSLGTHDKFWAAYELYRSGESEANVRQSLPLISTTLTIEYSKEEELGSLADFIIDLNEECTSAQIAISYALAAGKIARLFADLNDDRVAFFKALKERVPKFFEATIVAQDPNDPTNRKSLGGANLRSVLQFAFINAQRALDDASNKERAVLGKIFEKLFSAASSETASNGDQAVATAFTTAADKVQNQINEDFNNQLNNLTPTFDLFG